LLQSLQAHQLELEMQNEELRKAQEPQSIEELAGTLENERDILQAIMENTHALLAYFDPQFNFVHVNAAYAHSAGYGEQELIGANHFALFPHPENQAMFERVRDTGQGIEFHARPFEYPDQPERGTTCWDWTLTPVKKEGRVQGLVLSLLKVTERERAEKAQIEALHESRQRQAEVSALLDGARTVLHHGEFESVARSIFDSCKTLIGASGGYVALLDKDGKKKSPVFGLGRAFMHGGSKPSHAHARAARASLLHRQDSL